MQSNPRSNGPRARALAVAFAALLTGVTACASDTDAGNDSAGSASSSSSSPELAAARDHVAEYTDAPTSFPEITPVSGVEALEGKTVWYIPSGASLPFLSSIGGAIESALDTIGVEVKTCDGKFQPTEMASCMDQAVQQEADAVITGYIDYALVPNSFDTLVAADIPVLVAGQAPSGGKADSPELAFYDTIDTQKLLQRLLVETTVVDSNGEANALYIWAANNPQTTDAAKYALEQFDEICADCTVADVSYTQAGIGKVPSEVSAALITEADTDYVVMQFDPAAGAVATAIQIAGKTQTTKLVTTGSSLDSMQRTASGQSQHANIAISGAYAGWQFADGIVRMMTDNPVEVTIGVVRAFDKTNASELTLTPDAFASNDWFGGDDFEQTFTGAWGRK